MHLRIVDSETTKYAPAMPARAVSKKLGPSPSQLKHLIISLQQNITQETTKITSFRRLEYWPKGKANHFMFQPRSLMCRSNQLGVICRSSF